MCSQSSKRVVVQVVPCRTHMHTEQSERIEVDVDDIATVVATQSKHTAKGVS